MDLWCVMAVEQLESRQTTYSGVVSGSTCMIHYVMVNLSRSHLEDPLSYGV